VDGVAGEGAEIETRRWRLAHEGREQCGERVVAAQLLIAVGGEEQDGVLGEGMGDGTHQVEADRIGPVQIIE
jgi:hypothetical protein